MWEEIGFTWCDRSRAGDRSAVHWGQGTRKTLVEGRLTGVREHVGVASMLGLSGQGGQVTRTQRAVVSVLLGRGHVSGVVDAVGSSPC